MRTSPRRSPARSARATSPTAPRCSSPACAPSAPPRGRVARIDDYLARPSGDGPWPGVVAIHESFGLNDDMRALSDRLAGMGYLTLAPDFYAGGRWWRCMWGAFRQLLSGRGPIFDRIDAARARLAARDDCTGTVGVIGFCLGGGFALQVAPRYDFAAASVNYGELPRDPESKLAGACPIVASYGGRDRTLRGRPEKLERILTTHGVEHDVKAYPDAGHSFLSVQPYPGWVAPLNKASGMHGGPHPPSAEDAWRRIDAFFSAHLS